MVVQTKLFFSFNCKRIHFSGTILVFRETRNEEQETVSQPSASHAGNCVFAGKFSSPGCILLVVTSTTPPMITAVPATIHASTISCSTNAPSATATTGFTYA